MSDAGFCPFAVNRNIPPGSNDPAIKPRLAILHVADMLGPSLYDYFKNRSGGIESHFYVRLDGTVEQYRSIYFQADANLDANDFAVSIETEGKAAGEWSEKQLGSIRSLLLWLHQEARIPLAKCQSWNGSGVGYHVMFGAPGHWTPVAKSCPGPQRIKQFESVLVPWLDRVTNPWPEPTPAPDPKPTLVDRIRKQLTKAIQKAKDGSSRQTKLRKSRHDLPKH